MVCFQLVEIRKQLLGSPSGGAPSVIVRPLASRIHAEIYRRSSPEHTTGWNDVRLSTGLCGQVPLVSNVGLTGRVHVDKTEGRVFNGWVISVIRTRFDHQDGQFRVGLGEAGGDNTASSSAWSER